MKQGPENGTVRLELPATYRYLNVLGAVVGAVLQRVDDIQERDILTYNIELALHETCTNIVEHAYAETGGRIGIALAVEENPRRLVVEVQDTGRSFDMSTLRQPDLDEPQLSGYGLFLVHNLVDQVTYHPAAGHNRWRLVKNL